MTAYLHGVPKQTTTPTIYRQHFCNCQNCMDSNFQRLCSNPLNAWSQIHSPDYCTVVKSLIFIKPFSAGKCRGHAEILKK